MLELLGLLFAGAAIGVIVSYIVIIIGEWKFCKRKEDIYEKLDAWDMQHKEVQISVNKIKPDKYIIRKRYSFDLINNVTQDYLRKKIKNDFAEEFEGIIEPYFMVDTDFDYACHEVRLYLWIARDEDFDGSIDDIWKEE